MTLVLVCAILYAKGVIPLTNKQFVDQLKKAVNSKTLYIMGCFGAPMNKWNKQRYTNNYAYNKQTERKTMIEGASADTFGFDCVCLVKGILWGWNADTNHSYGGAKYQSNGVPDTTITNLLKNYCTEQSTDFSKIEVGEFLTMDGHCGVYIGDGLAIESTPKWKNGVQITEVWNIKKTSSVGRTWVSHGKLKAVEYIKEEPKPAPVKCDVFCVFPENATDAEINSTRVEMERIGVRPVILTKRG